ncbi:MAG: histidine phosphatase family protein [Casimicrobiaceae bacterium]
MRILLLLAALVLPLHAAADPSAWALLREGGKVVLIRHAATDPGVGDPIGFRLDTCSTQRNLSPAGRKEAELLGAAFRAQRVPVARVLVSPWCRCLDTARIAFGGGTPEPALGNLFTHSQNTAHQQAAFKLLASAPLRDGNLILVTHGATIAAFTGINPGTAEAVIGNLDKDGHFVVAGRITVPD